MFRRVCAAALFAVAAGLPLVAQDAADELVVARIKTEGFQRSHVMETVGYLADVFGPRLRGSSNFKAAAEWARDRLTGWSLSNAVLEPGGFTGPGWTVTRFSVEMREPAYLNIIAHPLAWSPGTGGVVTGVPVLVTIAGPADFGKYRGKLRGAIVLNGEARTTPVATFLPEAKRFSDEQLAAGGRAIDPAEKSLTPNDGPDYAGAERARRLRLGEPAAVAKFLRDEGVAAVIVSSPLDSGLLRVTDAGGFDMAATDYKLPVVALAPPSFVIAREHYGRIARLLARSIPVKLELNLQVATSPPGTGFNVVAELPGTDARLKDEVVMLGAHLDSWHAATGATDNAAGSAVVMEAVRILRAIDARPRRTIRVALWDAEEGGHLGSIAYLRKHFGDAATGARLPDHGKLAAYFNLDNGTGRIRGVFLQGNEAVRPIFEAWLKPFHYLGASTLAIQSVGGTDHLDFDHVGLPAFQFIQDPIDYEERTHHTNMDVYESVIEEDLKQASVIMASFAYHAAMRDLGLPRKTTARP